MTGPRTDVGEAEFLEELSDIARMKVDAEALGDDALEINASPAHDGVDLPVRTRRDDRGQLGQLIGRKTRRRTIRPIVNQAVGSPRVEAMNPVAQVWRSVPPVFAAEPRSMPSRTAASDRSRRLWLTVFDRRANARSAAAE